MTALMDGSMNDLAMLILLVVIIIFVIVLIVLVFHFIGTTRKVNKTIDEIQPTIDAANKVLEDIQPAIKRVDPLMERVSLTVDAVNLEIMRADTILADISEVTSTATGAVTKVAEITDAPLNLLNSATDKVRDLFGSSKEKRQAEKIVRRSAEVEPKQSEESAGQTGTAFSGSGVEPDIAPVREPEALYESVKQRIVEPAQEGDDKDLREQALDQIYASQEPGAAPQPGPAPGAQPVAVDQVIPQTVPLDRSVKMPEPAPADQTQTQGFTPLSLDGSDSRGTAQSTAQQQSSAVQVDYIPDFEPDEVIDAPEARTPQSKDQEGFYLFYTDDEGLQEGKRNE